MVGTPETVLGYPHCNPHWPTKRSAACLSHTCPINRRNQVAEPHLRVGVNYAQAILRR